MSRMFVSLCLDDVNDLDWSPTIHTQADYVLDQRPSVHISFAENNLSLWARDAEKFRALAASLTRAADALDAATAEKVEGAA